MKREDETIEKHLAAGHRVEIEPTMLADDRKAKLTGRHDAILFCWAFWQDKRGRPRVSRFIDTFIRPSARMRDEEVARLCDLPNVFVMDEARAELLHEAQRKGRAARVEAPEAQ